MTTTRVFGPYQATVLAVHDGDTATFRVVPMRGQATAENTVAWLDVGWGVTTQSRALGLVRVDVVGRFEGCNAPELSTPEGVAARDWVVKAMPVGTVVTLKSLGWDKYGGRSDVTIGLPGGLDLVTELIAAGHAKAWDGQGVKPT